ncbi:hypothetical protein CBS101457_003061 [Exobasidium rhododendri]|nr:hypothetical protein CBS101457_003061 [Exobasidium rhododendri]
MSLPILPVVLSSLTEKEAIADVLYRLLAGLDSNDLAVFESAWYGTNHSICMDSTLITGKEVLRTNMFNVIGPMNTTHMVSNVRIDWKEGATTAAMTAYALAQHFAPGQGREAGAQSFLAGASYHLNLIKDEGDGLWKCEKFVANVLWSQGDRAIMHNTSERTTYMTFV